MSMISKVKPVVEDLADGTDWFETWFDSPYYHILYKNRDEQEAELFLDKLILFLNAKIGARMLDVACGKGRHSIYLNRKGFDVTGFDLSPKSISHDKQFENEALTFYLHDMREVFRSNYFDFILNLFSSFGYFRKERDNIRCLIANSIALKPNGIFVFDYFNAKLIRDAGNSMHERTVNNILFHIDKSIDENFISKKISFSDNGKNYLFEEKLLLATKTDLEKYFSESGLEIKHCFGSYMLEPFDENKSERLIFIAQKKSTL